jgi:hypothetical protein
MAAHLTGAEPASPLTARQIVTLIQQHVGVPWQRDGGHV